MTSSPDWDDEDDGDAQLTREAQMTADALAVLSGNRTSGVLDKQQKSGQWSIFPRLTVRYAFRRKLTFCGLKRYITVGQLREHRPDTNRDGELCENASGASRHAVDITCDEEARVDDDARKG